MEDAIEILDDLVQRIEYGDITRDQVLGKLAEIREYLQV